MHYAKTKRRRKLTTSDTAKSGADRERSASGASDKSALQGEGNYEAAREFNAAERRFVESGRVAAAAREAAAKTETERQDMLAAEQQARSRAKEDYPPPPEASPRGTPAARGDPSKDAPRRRR